MLRAVLECVINVSEGRDPALIAELAACGGSALLDVHRDAHHHRSVLTLVGEEAARAVAAMAVGRLDLRRHRGAHPRLGVVDVVPFVPLGAETMAAAVAARDRFAAWLAADHGVPCFLYGPERPLPELRRRAFVDLAPDHGPPEPHPTAGATSCGARSDLIAFNVWLAPRAGGTSGRPPTPHATRSDHVGVARQVAAAVRGPALRALGLQVGDRVQVSMNLIDPHLLGPAAAYDAVAAALEALGAATAGAELVGLLPAAVLAEVPSHRWDELDLAPERTIEARLEAAGLR